jgi:lipopolysaccharide transport system permease protein
MPDSNPTVTADASERAPDGSQQAPLRVIEPRRQGAIERVRELRQYRGLLGYFGARSMEKITARTVLGRWWLVLRPVLDILTGALIFGGVLAIQSPQVPYVLFFLAGATCWRLMETGLLWATRSLEIHRRLLSKVYFPRLLLPFAALAPALIEFACYLAALGGAIVYFSLADGTLYLNTGPELLAAVGALAMSLTLALGIGLWTAVLGANARDVRYSLMYFTAFWYLLTPVVYPLSLVPERFRGIAEINPMTPIVELFKWGLVGAGEVRPVGLVIAGALIAAAWAGGLWFFGRAEAQAVDGL